MLMKTRRTNEPLRGNKHRSRAFQRYLLEQTPERAAEILAGERAFDELRRCSHSVAAASERDYEEDLLGPESKIGEGSGDHVGGMLGLGGPLTI